MAPFVAVVVRKLEGRFGDSKGLLIAFVAFATARLFLEYCTRLDWSSYPISLHTDPAVRLLEFSMAYVAGVAFVQYATRVREMTGNARALVGLFELLVLIGSVFAVITFDKVWWRFGYVLMFVALVFSLALGRGPVDQVLSLGVFEVFSHIETEFFLFHVLAIRFVQLALSSLGITGVKKMALASFVLAVGISCAYRALEQRVRTRCAAE